MLPGTTRPPRRMRVPGATCFSVRSVGELKKTIESLSAERTRPAARPSTATPAEINARRRCLRVMGVAYPSRTSGLKASSGRRFGGERHHIGARTPTPAALHLAALHHAVRGLATRHCPAATLWCGGMVRPVISAGTRPELAVSHVL